MVIVNLKEKQMSETLAAPILDPSELSPEDMDAIHEAERVINESLDRYIAVADTPNARKDVIGNIERQATADPKAFLAAREQLSNFTNEDDPTDEQIEKEDVLKDVLDGPVRARTVTKYGVFAAPTAEVRARVERAIAAVRDAESSEGKMGRRISAMNANSANVQSYGNAMANLSAAREANDAAAIETYSFTVRHLRRGMDIQSGNTGNTQKELDAVDAWIAKINSADVPDDDPRMKEEQAQALSAAMQQRAEAQEDLEKVQKRLRETPSFSAREKLRNLLDEHPEGIDVIHSLENTHLSHATGLKVNQAYQEKRETFEKAQEKVRELQSTLPAGDGRIALAQIDEYKAREAFNEADRHRSKDHQAADFLTELANENAIDKRVREEQDKAMGNLGEIMDSASDALFEWQHKGKAISEHGAFVGIKKVEAYISALDEKIALAQRSDRRLPHYRALRDEAFDSYLQLQYHKELVRTEMFANVGDFEGRHGLAHTPDKGILLERSNGAFIIYPDGTYCSVYENEAGEPQRTPRVNAQGEVVTTPVLEPINDPRDFVDSAMIRGWESMTLDNLKDVDAAVHGAWIRDPANTTARAQLEIVSGLIRERTAHEENTLTHMEVSYMERYLAVGRDGNADRLMPDGSVAGHMTLHGLEGNWLLHPNGAADLYTPGEEEPVSRYAPDGTVLNAFGPETDPSAPEPSEPPKTPESPDDGGSGEGGSDDEPDEDDTMLHPTVGPVPTPMPTPAPTRVTPGRPGAVGGVARPASMRVSAAGGAPTPPTPEAPNEPEAAPKPPSVKEREAREARIRAVEAAKNRTVITTSIAPRAGSLAPRGEYEAGKSYVPILGRTTFGDGANSLTEFRTREELWDEGEAYNLNVSPETFYIGPAIVMEEIGKPGSGEYAEKVQSVTMPDGSKETLFRVQYRFDAEKAGLAYPTAGDNSYPAENTLVVDTELPQSAVFGMLDAMEQNPNAVRDFARDLYARNVENGAEIWDEQGGRPPYDRLPADWKVSVIVPHRNGSNSIEVRNHTLRR